MNNTKVEHTPGPWRVRPGTASPLLYITADESVIALVQTVGLVTQANARLIAASPIMLEALRGLVSHCEALDRGMAYPFTAGWVRMRGALETAKQAIAAVEKGDA